MVKRVLMIAFHYPPLQGGSGILRTLAFSQTLKQYGWEPLVLTVTPGAHAGSAAIATLDDCCPVHRSRALDTSRHLAFHGRYPDLLALPDRWISWAVTAIPAGLRLIRRYRPDLIWSTYPIATAHLVALALHRLTGVPWVADQRDPMLDTGYPPDARRRRLHAWIERQAMQRCAAVVCTTPGAVRALRARHPGNLDGQVRLIENGYDETAFRNAEQDPPAAGATQTFRLLHSGVIYPSERDPEPLFAALAMLHSRGDISPASFRLVLRASGHDNHLRPLIARHPGLAAMVELAPPLPYRAALREMLDADGLLLLQAGNCNAQIPAKLYEYLRARRPVLALTDAAGDTAAALRAAGIDTIARLDHPAVIAKALRRFLYLARQGQAPLAPDTIVTRHARCARTRELGALFDTIHRQELP